MAPKVHAATRTKLTSTVGASSLKANRRVNTSASRTTRSGWSGFVHDIAKRHPDEEKSGTATKNPRRVERGWEEGKAHFN